MRRHFPGHKPSLIGLFRTLPIRPVCQLAIVGMLIGLLVACSDGVQLSPDAIAPSGENPVDPENPGSVQSYPLARHDSVFKATHYAGASNCSSCHDGISDSQGNDVSINKAWESSLMANSARDPYWIAKVAAELDRHAAHADEINQACSRCHAPMANDAANKDGAMIEILGDAGVLNPSNSYFDHAMDGVSCTLCHQIDDDGLLGTDAGASGNYTVVQQLNRSDRPAYGSYVDPVGAFMLASVQFNPLYGAHMSESSVCASCHNLFTPTIDATTGALGISDQAPGFPEQMIYTEWLSSAFAQEGPDARSCQDCHMPEAAGTVQIATRGATMQRAGFSRHDFLGANTVMQSILRDNREALGISVSADEFDASIARNRAFLATAAAISFDSNERVANTLFSQVRIENFTGHKLPSGFLSRRVFVHFVVADANGDIVFESGSLNADGSIPGADSDSNYTRYELHHDVIDSPEQVQIYEAVVADSNDDVTQSLLSAARYIKDNRLLPAGFAKFNAPATVQATGQAIDDDNFTAVSDIVNYQVELSGTGPWQVKAELVYQPLAYPHLQELFTRSNLTEVEAFRNMVEASPFNAEALAISTSIVD